MPIKILAASFLLMATVIVNCYSGNLMSALTVPRLKPAINSLEELAASKDLVLTVNVKSVFAETILVSKMKLSVFECGDTHRIIQLLILFAHIQNSNSSTFKAIGDAMRRKPESMYLTPAKGLKNILSLKFAFPTVECKHFAVLLLRLFED